MKNRKNKTQRQEVRRILAAMRRELRDYSLDYEELPATRQTIHLNEVIRRARQMVQPEE